jgi:hypothetical protein
MKPLTIALAVSSLKNLLVSNITTAQFLMTSGLKRILSRLRRNLASKSLDQ